MSAPNIMISSQHQIPHGSVAKRATSPAKWIELTVGVRRREPVPAMDSMEERPSARTYLTHAALATAHGPDPEALARVEAMAAAYHLTVLGVDDLSSQVHLGGHVGDLSRAFGVQVNDYSHAELGDFHARTGPVQLPRGLQAADITGVFGFSNHRTLRRQRATRGRAIDVAAARAASSRAWFYPPELAEVYHFPATDAAGQCIGVLEFGGGIVDADLEMFCAKLGIAPPALTTVTLNGVSLDPSDAQSTGEVMLDLEIIAALAPKASIVAYFSTFDEKGLVDAIAAAIQDTKNQPSVLSISWGWAENQPFTGNSALWSPAAIDHCNEQFLMAAQLGITVCVSTGDDGSEAQIRDGRAHVSFPATSPSVLAVGGTSLRARRVADKLVPSAEVVWNDGPGSGTGGGISDCTPRPAWQTAVPPSINPGAYAGRGIPDVAANADPSTGYAVCIGGQFQPVGGTSASAPLWASLVALINASRKMRTGNFNAILYKTIGPAGAALRDITRGHNDTEHLLGGQFAAGPGWDACTGWGVPDGQALLPLL